MRTAAVLTGALVWVLGLSAAHAQGVVMQKNLSLAMAKTIAEAAIAECVAKGFNNTSAAVVDRSGQVMVVLRNEGASIQTVEMARRKAYTAKMFRTSTSEFQKRTAADPTLLPQRDVEDILALGGGLPIQIGNDFIGGVGSSGSSQTQDEACAKAGLDKVAHLLK
jgi:uncharacterized protein GlcG (DUF336 family)